VALVSRGTLRTPTARILGLTFAAFTLAILGTEYSFGGGAEWGGRYFAVGLVAAIPLAVAGYAGAAARLTRAQRNRVALCLGVVALLTLTTMVSSLRSAHQETAAVNRAIAAAARAAGPAGDGEAAPVVVTAYAVYPRLAWSMLDEQRWVLIHRDDLGDELDDLERLGVERLVYVSVSGRLDADRVSGTGFEVQDSYRGAPGRPGTWVAVLRVT
jgi:hypothetical protein